MLRALKGKLAWKINGQCKQRCRNPEEEPKRKHQEKKTIVTIFLNAFNGLIRRLQMAEKIS